MSEADARRERCRTLRRVADLCRGGMRAFEQGRGPLGERMTRDALDLVRGLGGLTVLEGRIHNNLGVMLHSFGRREEALDHYDQALRLIRERAGRDCRLYRVVEGNCRKTLNRELETAMQDILAAAG